MTIILSVDPRSPDRKALKVAASIIRQGGLVAFPTETVYGLGADALNEKAVEKLYRVKRRPKNTPLTLHLASPEDVYRYVEEVPQYLEAVLDKLLPGPITIVLKRKKDAVPDIVTAGLDTVGIRVPAHPVAIEFIKECGTPLVAPSANLSGKPSPTKAEHVARDFWGSIEAIIDSGETLLGLESTIVDFTKDPPVILRPGPLTPEQLESILGRKVRVAPHEVPAESKPRYRPETPLYLVDTEFEDAVEKVIDVAKKLAKEGPIAILATEEHAEAYGSIENAKVIVIGSVKDMYTIAKKLFDKLRELDELGVKAAVAEPVPEKGIGIAIMYRLRKAALRIIK